MLQLAEAISVCSDRDTLNSISRQLRGGPVVFALGSQWRLLTAKSCVGAPVTRRVVDLPSLNLATLKVSSTPAESLMILKAVDASYGLLVDGEEPLGLVSQERLESGCRDNVLRGTVHDLNNILGVVTSLVELIQEGDGQQGDLSLVVEMAHSASCLVRRLGGATPGCEPLELREFLSSVLPSFQAVWGLKIRLLPSGPPELWIRVNRSELHQVVTNLVLNAEQMSPERGVLEVQIERQNRQAVVTFRDFGPGFLPGTDPSDLFNPGFSTRPDGDGLGLYQVRRIVEGVGGSVTAHNLGAGAALELRFAVESMPEDRDSGC